MKYKNKKSNLTIDMSEPINEYIINNSKNNLIFKAIQRYNYLTIISKLEKFIKDDKQITPDELPEIQEITGGQIQDEKSLIEEAKKYKSADEFIKAQGETLYHGGTKIDEVGNMKSEWGAFYMTDNPTYAKSYGAINQF